MNMDKLEFILSKNDDEVAKIIVNSEMCIIMQVYEVMPNSTRLREIGPLMITGLISRYPEIPEIVNKMILQISRISRYHETYTFLIEAFMDTSSPYARGILIDAIANTFKLAKTGPLAKKRAQFLLQCVNQFLLKFENEKFPTAWEQPILRFIEIVTDPEIFIDEESAMSEVVWKDTVTILLLRVNQFLARKYFTKFSHSPVELLQRAFFTGIWQNFSVIANAVIDRVFHFRASDEKHLTELQEEDIAWFITAAFKTGHLFKIFNPDFVATALIKAAQLHFKTSDYPPGFADISAALEISENKLPKNLIYELILAACTAPPRTGPLGEERNGLEISDRQFAYMSYCKAFSRLTLDDAMQGTLEFFKKCRDDSAMGIYVKVGKDRWTAAPPDEAVKWSHVVLEIFQEISSSEFPILDATDSLSAILNWLRVVLVRDRVCDRKFVADRLDIVKRKIDAELRTANLPDLQRTRVLLIGDLTKCVSELLDRKCPFKH